MGWIERWAQGRRLRRVLAALAEQRGSALPQEMEAAIAETVRAMSPDRLGRPKPGIYAAIMLAFARQAADGRRRLADPYWSSGGRNVGLDVVQAAARARVVVMEVMGRRPRSRRPLADAVDAMDRLVEAWRKEAADPDGYGIGTLHEIRRDLADLAIGESQARN